MSYPGHVRSLHLSGRRSSFTDHVNGRDIHPPDKFRKRRYTGLSPIDKDNGSLESGSNCISPGEILDNVCDDRGNEARRSLWIGNISRGISESEVRAVFGLGDPDAKIQSIRIQNKNQECYIFVNYREIEHAIQALYQYHEQDAFNRGRPVYIRFAKSQEEAVKEKIETSRMAVDSDVRKKGTAPPTGPRAMRRSISPPARRKSSSSHKRPEHSSQEKSVRGYKRKRSRDQFAYDNCYRPTYRDDDDHEYRLVRQNSRKSLDSRNKADCPQAELDTSVDKVSVQHREKLEHSASIRINEDQQDGLPTRKLSIESVSRSAMVDLDGMDFPFPSVNKFFSLSHQEGGEIAIKGAAARELSRQQGIKQEDNEGTANGQQPFDHLVRLFEAHEQAELLKIRNRLLKPPSNHVRTATEETVSVLSDITSSSRPSSIRRKLCAKCDKPETTLSSLSLKCSHCPRKFHSACVNLSRSSAEDGSFVCSRCLRKGRAKSTNLAQVAPAASTENPSTTISDYHNKQNSPELELRNDDTLHVTHPSINTVPPSNPTDTCSVPADDEIDGSEYSPQLNPTSPTGDDNRELEMGAAMTLPANTVPMNNARICEDAESMIARYKNLVTCTHWEKGGCWRNEGKDCMFAHRHTEIGSPRCQRSSKRWTCYYWKSQGTCPHRNCMHAHLDTGLYVGFDGWASKKHLTCPFYYNRGHCKKADEECPYAHQDTGFLAPEPKGFVSKPAGEPNEMSTSNVSGQNAVSDRQNLHINSTSSSHHQAEKALLSNPHSTSPNLAATSDCNRPDTIDPFANAFASVLTEDAMLRPQLHLKINGIKNLVSKLQTCNNSTEGLPKLNEVDNKRSVELTQDPRKPKADITSPQTNSLSNLQASIPGSNVQLGRPSGMMPPDAEHSASRQLSMRECKICGKKVMKSDICVSCKESKSPTHPPSPIKITSPNVNELKPQEKVSYENNAQGQTDAHLDSLISGEFDAPAPRDKSPTKVLKRAASGSNMFLPNKRSRPSVTATPAGTITEVRLHGTKLVTDQPSIETLIKQAKSSKAPEDASALEVDDFEDHSPRPVTEPVTASKTILSKEPLQTSPTTENVPESNDHPPHRSSDASSNQILEPNEASNLFFPRLPSVDTSMSAHKNEQGGVDGLFSQSIYSTAMIDAESELQKWVRNPAESNSVPRSRSSSISGDSDVPLAMLDARKSLTGTSTSTRYDENRKVNSTPKRRCTCAHRRRKCLHVNKDQDRLDPQKCYDWITLERARGSEFKGRSKVELDLIKESALSYADDVSRTEGGKQIDSEDLIGTVQEDLGSLVPPQNDLLEKHKEHLKGPSTSGSADSTGELFDNYRDLFPTDEETDPSTHSSPPTICDQPKPVQNTVLMRLKQRGVEFESSDDDSDAEDIPEFSIDRLACSDTVLPSISKGQGLKNRHLLCERQMTRNQHSNNNPHCEIVSSYHKHLIRAKVQYNIRHDNIDRDQYLPDSIVIQDEEMTLQEFLGIPQHMSIEPCLSGQGITGVLAFREKDKDQGQGMFDYAGIRNKRRVNDGQKWPLTER